MISSKLSLFRAALAVNRGRRPFVCVATHNVQEIVMQAHPHNYAQLNSLVDRAALFAGQLAMLAALPVAAFTILVGSN
jgi:hypothetical protein